MQLGLSFSLSSILTFEADSGPVVIGFWTGNVWGGPEGTAIFQFDVWGE